MTTSPQPSKPSQSSQSPSATSPTVKLFNTLTRQVEPFTPINPPEVKLYCCGPTVYDFPHVGNMRAYTWEDVLARTLRFAGYKVTHVMNITDVGHLVGDQDDGEDKMAAAARREKKKSAEIANFYTEKFFRDTTRLNIIRPDIVCKATEHIAEMIALIQRLEARGMTYIAGGNVYFDVAKFPTYGKLARLKLDQQQSGARVEVDSNKRSHQDFVLWFTKSKFENQELQWQSPWGAGYPGWHIECSAMAMKYLGEHFDIHCGGIDHIPVHHTNEIAQAEGATGKPWVNVWMHGDFLLMNNQKISKSTGKFLVLDDVIAFGIDPLAYRFFLLSGHYRGQLNFSEESLRGAQSSFVKLRDQVLALKASAGIAAVMTESPYITKFTESICDDLNTAQSLAVLWEVLGDKQLSDAQKLGILYRVDQCLGLGMEQWQASAIPAEILELATQRDAARKGKNFAESDRLRAEIEGRGYAVKDSPQGTIVTKK